jgi:hypothetical protein
MVEWYPHVLTVSTLYPQGPQKTLNVVEFYYPEEIAAFEREFVEAQQAAYMETCIEDDEIAERMDAGRKALMRAATTKSAPTRARWKTACSTSTSGTAARWGSGCCRAWARAGLHAGDGAGQGGRARGAHGVLLSPLARPWPAAPACC